MVNLIFSWIIIASFAFLYRDDTTFSIFLQIEVVLDLVKRKGKELSTVYQMSGRQVNLRELGNSVNQAVSLTGHVLITCFYSVISLSCGLISSFRVLILFKDL